MGKKNKGQKLPIVPIKDGKKGGASGSGDAARPTTTKDTETSGSSDRSVKQTPLSNQKEMELSIAAAVQRALPGALSAALPALAEQLQVLVQGSPGEEGSKGALEGIGKDGGKETDDGEGNDGAAKNYDKKEESRRGVENAVNELFGEGPGLGGLRPPTDAPSTPLGKHCSARSRPIPLIRAK